MFRESEEGRNLTGNDRFEGYCVDLTKRIAEVLNFTYELRLVKDNKFGSKGNLKIILKKEKFFKIYLVL